MVVSDKDFIKQRTEVLNKFGIIWLEDLKKGKKRVKKGQKGAKMGKKGEIF